METGEGHNTKLRQQQGERNGWKVLKYVKKGTNGIELGMDVLTKRRALQLVHNRRNVQMLYTPNSING